MVWGASNSGGIKYGDLTRDNEGIWVEYVQENP